MSGAIEARADDFSLAAGFVRRDRRRPHGMGRRRRVPRRACDCPVNGGTVVRWVVRWVVRCDSKPTILGRIHRVCQGSRETIGLTHHTFVASLACRTRPEFMDDTMGPLFARAPPILQRRASIGAYYRLPAPSECRDVCAATSPATGTKRACRATGAEAESPASQSRSETQNRPSTRATLSAPPAGRTAARRAADARLAR